MEEWGNEAGASGSATNAGFVRIYDKTFTFPRKSQENLVFPAQTPRSQCDRMIIQLFS
jgi:hypothetical protein